MAKRRRKKRVELVTDRTLCICGHEFKKHGRLDGECLWPDCGCTFHTAVGARRMCQRGMCAMPFIPTNPEQDYCSETCFELSQPKAAPEVPADTGGRKRGATQGQDGTCRPDTAPASVTKAQILAERCAVAERTGAEFARYALLGRFTIMSLAEKSGMTIARVEAVIAGSPDSKLGEYARLALAMGTVLDLKVEPTR